MDEPARVLLMATYRAPGWAARPAQPPTLLTLKDGVEVEPRILVSEKGILFGRTVEHAPPATLRLDHGSISREHAAIVHAFSGESFLIDLDSRYGTSVDGKKIQPRSYVKLQDRCEIQFGESDRILVTPR